MKIEKNKQLVVSSFLIIFAFFLGYFFEKTKIEEISQKQIQKNEYVNILLKKKSLEVTTSSDTIKVLINGQESASWSINLP